MDQKYEFEVQRRRPIVYVKPIFSDELPADVRAQMPSHTVLYAVHDKDGDRLAVVRDRKLAFALARQHDMEPVSVN